MDDFDGIAESAAPATMQAFFERLATRQRTLPRRLKQCADYVQAHAEAIALSTVSQVAAGAGVAPSAVMRFAQAMGFAGFSDLQRLFRAAHAPGRPDYAMRLSALRRAGGRRPGVLLAESVEAGRRSLERLASSIDLAALDRAAALLSAAGTVHVIGLRRAFPVAAYLAYMFEKMSVPALLHDGTGGFAVQSALRVGDAVLAISFAPYSAETLAFAGQAWARGLDVVAITDAETGTLAKAATVLLRVEEQDFGAFRALSATMALSLALAVSVGAAREGLSTAADME